MLHELENEFNKTTTENGANTNKSTKSALLDFFAIGGSMRNLPVADQISLVIKSWNEDKTLTLKAIFYFRDIRGGQGQRCGFYEQIKWLANNNSDELKDVLHLIPEFGRWDDLYQLIGTPLESAVLDLMFTQFNADLKSLYSGETVSLLGKWLKSENASSKETKRLATITRHHFKLDSATYRKSLSTLRGFIGIVERKMSSGDWSDIDYGKVPSQAMLKYKTAFYKHDESGMTKFIEDVTSGDAKVNTSTLYPQQIVSDVLSLNYSSPAQIDMLWNNLPDYINGRSENSIAVVDVSGSMAGTPMYVAISLGLYLAERTEGLYKNKFITFSESPTLETVVSGNIVDKVKCLKSSNWGFRTNLESVFQLVLNAAVNNNLPQDEMIDKLYIISDMEFNDSTVSGYPTKTLMKHISNLFRGAGYKMPQLVFWNVAGRNIQYPMTISDEGVQMVSGFSPSIFENLMGDKFLSAYDLMVDVLTAPRYDLIVIK